MAKFCTKCGNPLDKGVMFCTKCGAKVAGVTPSAQKQTNPATVPTPPSVKPNAAKAVNILGGTMLAASPIAGEVAVGGFSPFSSGTNILNPLKTVLNGIKRLFTGFKNISENKKGLIVAIVLAVVWIVLTLFPLLGVNPLPVKLASWLTFAQGGLKGGVIGFIGGIIGKGMFATLIISLFSGSFNGVGSGLKKLFSGFNSGSAGMTLVGIGVALMLFNLIAGVSSPIQSMAGVTGFLLSLKSLGGGGGFIRRLAMSLTANKNGNTRMADASKCTAFLYGLSFGFAAGTALSLVPWGYLPYCLGAAAIVAGVIFGIVFGSEKGVSAQ